MLYLWVAGSSKVTRVGRCPLFVFQGSFYGICSTAGTRPRGGGARGAELRTRGVRRPAAARVGGNSAPDRDRSAGSRFDELDRERCIPRFCRGETPARRRIGWHCRLSASEPG